MLNQDVANVPQDKGHRPPWLGAASLGFVPVITAAIDATGAMAVDVNAFPG